LRVLVMLPDMTSGRSKLNGDGAYYKEPERKLSSYPSE